MKGLSNIIVNRLLISESNVVSLKPLLIAVFFFYMFSAKLDVTKIGKENSFAVSFVADYFASYNWKLQLRTP